MILDFGSYIINEASLKKFKRQVHGALNMSARKRMRKELRGNIITFKFKKRNGEIRTAHGTLHPDYLPKLRGGAPRPEHQMVYYDLDKEGWRSFRSFTFIKILNIKPVDGTGKPISKPVHKSEDEDEEVKKTTPTKEVEKEKEKEVHTEEKKEKKKVHEIEDEIEDDDEKKSVLDDKETPEEEEVIKKDREKDLEEEDKDKKKDKDEKSEEE